MIDQSEMIFGVRAVIEAIQAGKEIDKILVKKDIQSDLSKELFAALKGMLIPAFLRNAYEVPDSVLQYLQDRYPDYIQSAFRL